ncbi:MAG TPA: hypothetical protein VGP36_22655 [Mycobacteriales bacterium]|jgi:hypothetical protein|nr:hypothetical protein [Mycobacteriales bacterium]
MLSTMTAPAAEFAARHRVRRAQRAERDRLRTELASYRTPAERADLEAMFARHSAAEIAELEDLLRR